MVERRKQDSTAGSGRIIVCNRAIVDIQPAKVVDVNASPPTPSTELEVVLPEMVLS